jgi:hypothetical protein
MPRPLRLAVLASCFPLLPGPLQAQALPDGDLLLTRAERTDFRETTRYAEVMDLAARLAARSPDIHLTTMGYTTEGRAIPLVVVGAPDATPESVRATGKTRVYLQGNIHAGEVPGKEALLILLRRLAGGEYSTWTDSLVLLSASAWTTAPGSTGPSAGWDSGPTPRAST